MIVVGALLDRAHFMGLVIDEAELAGVTGGRLLGLAHRQPSLADEAAVLITRAIEARPANVLRSESLDRLGLVEVRLLQRELDEATTIGHQAADVVERTQSDRARVKLREVYDLTSPYRGHKPVADLRERLAGILEASAA